MAYVHRAGSGGKGADDLFGASIEYWSPREVKVTIAELLVNGFLERGGDRLVLTSADNDAREDQR